MVLGKVPGRDGFAICQASPLGFSFDVRKHVRSSEACAAHHLRQKDHVVVQPISQHQLFLDTEGNMSSEKENKTSIWLARVCVCLLRFDSRGTRHP